MTRNGDDWEIWTIDSDGRNPTQVFDGMPIVDELRATADGKFFVFNADVGDGNYQLFRLGTDGSGLAQITFNASIFAGDSSPSHDGQWIVYTGTSYEEETPSTAIYRIPIEGGEPAKVAVTSTGPFTPHHSPDGRYLSYVDFATMPTKIVVQSVTDGSSRSFDVPATGMLNVGAIWSPDSRSLAYVAFNEGTANVWLQPINGGKPRQLTDFVGGRIHRIAYSTDGKHLYLARDYAVNQAILIKGFAN